jgi:hypothetical protein
MGRIVNGFMAGFKVSREVHKGIRPEEAGRSEKNFMERFFLDSS